MSANSRAHAQRTSDLQARVEAERAGQPFLLFTDGGGTEQLFVLGPDRAVASVGRTRSSDLVLGWDGEVSRQHARFERAGEDWEIVDDGRSLNGTSVNGERVTGRRRLNDDDRVRFGTTTVTFRAPRRLRPGAAAEQRVPDRPARAAAERVPDRPPRAPAVDLSTTQRRVLAALCRPYQRRGAVAGPATDEQIAEELFLSVGSVKAHITVLYAKLGIEQTAESARRMRLVERAFADGLVSERDL